VSPAVTWVEADGAWWGSGPLGPSVARLAGGRVAELAPAGQLAVPKGADVVRLAGTLLPGLIDWHAHAGLVDLAAVRAGGIGTVRDLGWPPATVAALATEAARPGSRLPAVRLAGAFLAAPGGYPTGRDWAPAGSVRAVADPAAAADAVAEQAALGACVIKLTLNAEAGPVPPPAVVEAVVAAAAGHGLGVAAHAQGAGQAELAWRCGVAELAHAPWTERLEDGVLAAMAADMSWVGTFDIHGYGAPSAMLARALDNARRFVAAGGRLRYGTDLGNGPLPLGVNPREVRAMQRAGLDPDGVLAAMTVGPGEAPPCWVPGRLDLDPEAFAASLAGARVLEPAA
jgi:imidazolonepropionase-like amidohydrolase